MITLHVPGSKSITNRALLLASLARGKSSLTNTLRSDDTKHMMRALRTLGPRIRWSGTKVHVQGVQWHVPARPLYCGNAGTAMRFLTAVLASQPFESELRGDKRMHERPIGDLTDTLTQLGGEVKFLSRYGYPPLRVVGPLHGGFCEVSGNVSSQFLSGLLIAAPLAQRSITIKVKGTLVSGPYVALTMALMKQFGVTVIVRKNGDFFIPRGQKYAPANIAIEGDATSASYFWALSALTREKISITNVPKGSIQADLSCKRILDTFYKLPTTNSKLSLNCRDFPDSAMTLAIAAAFRRGTTKLTGLANLRVKECDRLAALAIELKKIGAGARAGRDSLTIQGSPNRLHPARIKTYSDHRMAMCFAVAGFLIPGVEIENPECVKKTYPHFWRDLKKLKATFLQKNIVLTGMRGTGKTTLGKLLAKKLRRKCIDMDALIEGHAKQNIAAIVARSDWRHFRKLERKIIDRLKNAAGAVIATGGGALISKANEKAIRMNGKIIVLQSSLRSMHVRLKKEGEARPSLTGGKTYLQELSRVYEKRSERYHEMADATVDVSKQSRRPASDLREKVAAIETATARLGLLHF